MQLRDVKITVKPDFDAREIPRFSKELAKATARAGVSMVKGFTKALGMAGRGTMYLNQAVQFFDKIYKVLTRVQDSVKGTFELAKSFRQTARESGVTEGQVAITSQEFAKYGISAAETSTLLTSFVKSGREKLFLKDGENPINQLFGILEALGKVSNRFQRNEISKYYFNKDAEEGGVVDISIKNRANLEKGIKNNYKNGEGGVDYKTAAIKHASSQSDALMHQGLYHQIQIMMKAHGIRGLMEMPLYQQAKFNEVTMSGFNSVDIKSMQKSVENIAKLMTSANNMIDKGVNTLQKLLERFMNLDEVLAKVEKGFDLLIENLIKLAPAIEALMNLLSPVLKFSLNVAGKAIHTAGELFRDVDVISDVYRQKYSTEEMKAMLHEITENNKGKAMFTKERKNLARHLTNVLEINEIKARKEDKALSRPQRNNDISFGDGDR